MYAIVYDEHYMSVSDFQWNKEEKERYCLTGNSCRQKSRTLCAHLDQKGAEEVHKLMHPRVENMKRTGELREIQDEINRLNKLLQQKFVSGVKEIFNEIQEDRPHLFIGE